MSKQSPYDNISISEGGRFVRYEWDAHYLTDEQMETVRKHVETLQTENRKLRELVRRLVYATHPADRATLIANAAELGIEVDA